MLAVQATTTKRAQHPRNLSTHDRTLPPIHPIHPWMACPWLLSEHACNPTLPLPHHTKSQPNGRCTLVKCYVCAHCRSTAVNISWPGFALQQTRRLLCMHSAACVDSSPCDLAGAMSGKRAHLSRVHAPVGHRRNAGRGSCPRGNARRYLSISPNTTSRVPMMVTTSASMAPLEMTSSICRCA